MYVPRYFGESTYGVPDEVRLEAQEPKKVDMKFNGGLRDYLLDIVNTYMSSTKDGGGLLEIPCGRGKTVMALKIAAELGVKTLVIVHKTFLADQWIERIKQFIPNARIGRIQGQTIDIDDKEEK